MRGGGQSKSFSENGFTLAEVLITLGIIGVVAAMTLPVITQKIDKQTTVAKLKKSFATMHELILLSEKDNGEVWEWTFEDNIYDHAFNESDFFKKYFEPYIKKIGNYGEKSVSKEKYSLYTLDGNIINTIQSWAVLPDGSSFGLFNNAGVDGNKPGGGSYLWIFIDINGKNKPNMLGKDIFIAELVRKKRLIMWGDGVTRDRLINDTNGYSCKTGTQGGFAGGFCGALIQADGWEIKDDYPW